VAAQVLYPNIIGFDAHAFLDQLGPELATECVRAYNDFLAEFAAVAPKRFIPMMMLPFWDVDASVKEMARAHQLGHKGVLFAALLHCIGLPNISDPQWTPLLATAEEMGLSINYHVGFSVRTNDALAKGWNMRTKTALQKRTDRQAFVKNVTLGMASNTEAAAETILRGVASRPPPPQVRVRRERVRLLALGAGADGLALAELRSVEGVPRPGTPERDLAAELLRHVLVRARAPRPARGLRRQRDVRDRIPA
jgi:hypothetical protein